MESIILRISQIAENENIRITTIENKIGASKGVLSRALKNNTDIQSKWITKIVENYPKYDANWLITGKGEMLKSNNSILDKPDNLIPLYEDVHSIGGASTVACMDPATQPTDYINSGDWFPGATAAIRHYGDSMVEYPSGCILALKEVRDRNLIVWGRNYCVETSEFRVTKRLYNNGDFVTAYSTNEETYKNGQLIHPPFEIPKESIIRLFQILGYVVKEYSNGPVFVAKR